MLLRPRHYKAIELLATTDMTQKEIAKELGASPCTLRKWMKDEEFLSELARRREADPQSFRTLRLSVARGLVLQMLRRLRESEEALPVKEVVSLLARMISKDVAAVKPEPEPEPMEDEEPQFNADGSPRLTPEDVDRIWKEIESDEEEPDERQIEPERDQKEPEREESGTSTEGPAAAARHDVA